MKRTVQKEGANKGREFHVCPKPRDEQCNYFQWADQVQSGAPRPAQRQNTGQHGGHSGGQTGFQQRGRTSEEINCNCGQPSARRTVQKEGNNQGREFYVCARPRDEQCNYFQWADEMEGNGGQGGAPGPSFMRGALPGPGGAGGGVKRKAGGDTGGGAEKKQRKCGLCHEPGHTRLKCPMKSNWGSEDTGWS